MRAGLGGATAFLHLTRMDVVRGFLTERLGRAADFVYVVSDIAASESRSEVVEILEQASAPLGSWRRKHEQWGLALTGFVGVHYNYENPIHAEGFASGHVLAPALQVGLDVTHTWVGDLSFTLTSPGGASTVVFVDRPGKPPKFFGCRGDDILAMLDDDSPFPVNEECARAVPTIDGIYAPDSELFAFNGGGGNGRWTLSVMDQAFEDEGRLNDWSLELTCDFADLGNQLSQTGQDGKGRSDGFAGITNRKAGSFVTEVYCKISHNIFYNPDNLLQFNTRQITFLNHKL